MRRLKWECDGCRCARHPGRRNSGSPIATVRTVTFNASGGTGTMASQSASSATAPSSNMFVYSGYVFGGWATTPDGAVEYPNTGKYAFTESDTLYARWKCCIVTFDANGGIGTMTGQTASTATALTANTFTTEGQLPIRRLERGLDLPKLGPRFWRKIYPRRQEGEQKRGDRGPQCSRSRG